MRYCGRSGSRRSSEAGEASRQTAFLLARVLDRVFVGRAEITERSRAFTVSEDRKTDATSGSSTTATDPACIAPAKRFVRDRRYSNRYSRLRSSAEARLILADDVLFIISALSPGHFPRAEDPNRVAPRGEGYHQEPLVGG